MLAMALLDSTTDGLPLSGLGQLGAFGTILTILLSFGWYAYRREQKRADKLEQKLEDLNSLVRDQYVPSLEAARVAMTESAAALAVARSQRRS